MTVMIEVERLSKQFRLHQQGEMILPVLTDINLSVHRSECVVLDGASGSGKSTLLRALYGNYLASSGAIWVTHQGARVDLCSAHSQLQLAIRRETIGYVSQFLRVIPRVATIDVVSQPLIDRGVAPEQARQKAGELLQQLHIAERLWTLPPGTFSGGEQQRVNIARGLIADYPILLLDEPTASLDRANAEVVVGLIDAARSRGSAIIGIFHDHLCRDAIADRLFTVKAQAQA
ncbi:phosphonate C-P lyase system protein PhnL [Celerinatantimonas yamalensis]|uniref:Phosphonate C-P lyase system protein PhnL n=1 Tax=Celerinatantimonas yamalensis TaxID=559956 RepID=A0ABW9G841_9GAMM